MTPWLSCHTCEPSNASVLSDVPLNPVSIPAFPQKGSGTTPKESVGPRSPSTLSASPRVPCQLHTRLVQPPVPEQGASSRPIPQASAGLAVKGTSLPAKGAAPPLTGLVGP